MADDERVYIKPEEVDKLPKGLKIYRGPRGGLYYLVGERRMLEEEEKIEGKPEETKEEEERNLKFGVFDAERFEQINERIKSMADRHDFTFNFGNFLKQIAIKGHERLFNEVADYVSYYKFDMDYLGKRIIAGLAIIKQVLIDNGKHDELNRFGEFLERVGIDLDELEISENCFLERMTKDEKEIINLMLTDKYFWSYIEDFTWSIYTYGDYMHAKEWFLDMIAEGMKGRREKIEYYYVYAKMSGVDFRTMIERAFRDRQWLVDRIIKKGEEIYNNIKKIEKNKLSMGELKEAVEQIKSKEKIDLSFVSLFTDVYNENISNALNELLEDYEKKKQLPKEKYIFDLIVMEKVYRKLLELGFDEKTTMSLVKGCYLMRMWTTKFFRKYVGKIEEAVHKIKGNDRPKRIDEPFDDPIYNIVDENDVYLWKEFNYFYFTRKNVFGLEGKKKLYRGISEYEFLTLLENIIDKGVMKVKATSTLASVSFSKDMARRFGSKSAVIVIEKPNPDCVWGSVLNASPEYEFEEEVIYELGHNEEFNVFWAVRPVMELVSLKNKDAFVDFKMLRKIRILFKEPFWSKVMKLVDDYMNSEFYKRLPREKKKEFKIGLNKYIKKRRMIEQKIKWSARDILAHWNEPLTEEEEALFAEESDYEEEQHYDSWEDEVSEEKEEEVYEEEEGKKED